MLNFNLGHITGILVDLDKQLFLQLCTRHTLILAVVCVQGVVTLCCLVKRAGTEIKMAFLNSGKQTQLGMVIKLCCLTERKRQ